jgi:hypothetical protein
MNQLESNRANSPAHEIRLGSIKATLWLNETSAGPRYNVTIGRLYKDANDAWRTSESLGRDDLLLAAKVLDLAHSWLHANGE